MKDCTDCMYDRDSCRCWQKGWTNPKLPRSETPTPEPPSRKNKLRVWKIVASETEYICGYTLIHALQAYIAQTGIGIHEFAKEDEVIAVFESEWHRISMKHEEEGKMTILDYMKYFNPQPGLICSTAL